MIKSLVISFFDEWVADTFKSRPIVKDFLNRHERRGSCIDAIVRQVQLAELGNLGKRLNLRMIKSLVEAGAKMFANAAIGYAEEQALSAAETQRRIDQATVPMEEVAADLVARGVILEKPEKGQCK